MNADGTNLNNITDSMPVSMSTGYPSWSPDGTKIAFLSTPWSEAAGTPGIYVAKADGNKEPVNITSATTIPELYGPPVWSPDGTKIAFLSCPHEDGEDCDIYIMEADGSTNPVNITNRPQGYYGFGVDAGHTLDWQPLSPPTVPPPSSERCTISGTNGPDNLVGTHGRDVICALGGPDNIRGKDGKDVLYGGTGPDTLIGGPGKDRLVSGPGMDVTIQYTFVFCLGAGARCAPVHPFASIHPSACKGPSNQLDFRFTEF
jgi:hypothetical protein